MKIVSLVNSGESLDKAVALIDCAFKTNAAFYKSYEQVFVFYCNDLTKKKGQCASGSIKSFLDICEKHSIGCQYTREYIVDCLLEKGFLSRRGAIRLQIDEQRYRKFIENIPWYLVFDYERDRILDFMKRKYPNVEFINIGALFNARKMSMTMPYYLRMGKLYLLLRDGNIKAYRIGKHDIKLSKVLKTESQSIVSGGNVYSFIALIADYASNIIESDFCMGYRPASRFKRKSYDSAIEYINDTFLTEVEPKNVTYNKYYSLVTTSQINDLNYAVIQAAFFDSIKEIYGK